MRQAFVEYWIHNADMAEVADSESGEGEESAIAVVYDQAFAERLARQLKAESGIDHFVVRLQPVGDRVFHTAERTKQ